MFRYKRELILPYFLSKRMTVSELARRAGISHQSAQRAVEGEAVSAVIIGKVAEALDFNAMDYLVIGGKDMFARKKITVEDPDGMKKDVEISVADDDMSYAYWGDDDEAAHKAFMQYLAGFTATKKVERAGD